MSRVIKLKDQKRPPVQAGWQSELIGPARSRVQGKGDRLVPDSDGYDRGYRDGHAKGREEGLSEAREMLSRAEEARRLAEERVREGQRELEALRQEWRDSVLELALAVARRIVRRELSLQPEDVVSLVDALLAEARDQEDIKVLVNPGDAVTVEGQKEQLLRGLRATQRVEVVPDPGIEAGGVFLETPGGSWDARVESQLGAVAAALREVVSGGGEQVGD